MIQPVNGHILIEPQERDTFMQSERETFEEIGTVINADETLLKNSGGTGIVGTYGVIGVGDKVYFDAWLAAKFPKGKTEEDGFYWLVKWEDVRAVSYAKSK